MSTKGNEVKNLIPLRFGSSLGERENRNLEEIIFRHKEREKEREREREREREGVKHTGSTSERKRGEYLFFASGLPWFLLVWSLHHTRMTITFGVTR